MAPKGGAQKGGAQKGGGPEGCPKFRAFFSPVPPQNSFFSFLSGGSSRGILVVFEVPGRSNVHVWSSQAVVCEPRRSGLVGPPGFHTTVRESEASLLFAVGLVRMSTVTSTIFSMNSTCDLSADTSTYSSPKTLPQTCPRPGPCPGCLSWS